jgi:hypothetical protein
MNRSSPARIQLPGDLGPAGLGQMRLHRPKRDLDLLFRRSWSVHLRQLRCGVR